MQPDSGSVDNETRQFRDTYDPTVTYISSHGSETVGVDDPGGGGSAIGPDFVKTVGGFCCPWMALRYL